MKNLLWLGNPFFCQDMKAHGWNVIWHMPDGGQIFTWADCLRLAGCEPDLLVVGDTSRPAFVLGVENFPCLTVFYAVDTHIHSWMPRYGQAFDACLISLKDHIRLFTGMRLPEDRVWWSPPYAPNLPDTFPDGERRTGCMFVGTVSPEQTPLRVLFLDALRRLVPDLHVQWGNFSTLYPQTKVSINFCELGDLNFRVFESMGCGAALVTPDIQNGQGLLFEAGRHLLTFPIPEGLEPQATAQIAAEGAARQIITLLENDGQRGYMARTGFAEVNAHHRARDRAAGFHELTGGLTPALAAKRREQASRIRERYLKLIYLLWSENLAGSPARALYLKAAKGEI